MARKMKKGAATVKLREAAALLGVPLIDHLILGKAGDGADGQPAFLSLAESVA